MACRRFRSRRRIAERAIFDDTRADRANDTRIDHSDAICV